MNARLTRLSRRYVAALEKHLKLPNLRVKLHDLSTEDSVSSLIAAVESGAGVAIAPQSLTCTAGPRLKLIPFSPAPSVIGVAWANHKLTAITERFLKCAKDIALEK